MTTQKMLQNANKVVYLASQFPDHTLTQLIGLLQMPSIDINTAIWKAIELGWLSKPDSETGHIKVLQKPERWYFGEDIDDLQTTLLYAFEELATQETDMEEYSINAWLNGYPTHDFLVAMRVLIEDKQLHEYVIEDGKNKYTFYTLYRNKDKLWGRKQFKSDPLGGKDDDKDTSEASK